MTGLSRKQAAALADVSEDTVRGWVRRGLLAPLPGRPPRYAAAEVQATQATAHAGDVLPRWRANPDHAGQRLRRLREAAGLNQQQLARQAQLSHEQLSRLELGAYAPSAPTVHHLSQALGVAPTRFVDDTPIGLEMLSVEEAGRRLDVPAGRVRKWMRQGVLPGVKVGVEWRIPAIAIAELDRSERLRGRSRRLDPRYRG